MIIRHFNRINFDEFFEPLCGAQSWHNEIEKAAVKKFRDLRAFLTAHLKDLTVLEFGGTKKEIFIFGRDEAGHWLRANTQSVET